MPWSIVPDDESIGVKSTAILFADLDLFVIGGLQVLMLVGLVVCRQHGRQLGLWYLPVAGRCTALLMLYHQWLARDRTPGGLLRRLPAQSLHRHGDICRHCAELHVYAACQPDAFLADARKKVSGLFLALWGNKPDTFFFFLGAGWNINLTPFSHSAKNKPDTFFWWSPSRTGLKVCLASRQRRARRSAH